MMVACVWRLQYQKMAVIELQHTCHEIHPFAFWGKFLLVFNFALLIQATVGYSFVPLFAFAIAYVAFGSLSEHLKGLILIQSQPYLIPIEIYQFDFAKFLKDFDYC